MSRNTHIIGNEAFTQKSLTCLIGSSLKAYKSLIYRGYHYTTNCVKSNICYHPKASLCHHTLRPFMAHGLTLSLTSLAISAGPQTITATLSSRPLRKVSSIILRTSGLLRFLTPLLPPRSPRRRSAISTPRPPSAPLGPLVSATPMSPVRKSWTFLSSRMEAAPEEGSESGADDVAQVASAAERTAQTRVTWAVGLSAWMAR